MKKRILYIENGIGYGGAVICLRHLVRNLDKTQFAPLVVTGRTGPDYEGIKSEAQWKYIRDRYIDFNTIKKSLNSNSLIRQQSVLKKFFEQLISRADDLINFIPFFVRLLILVFKFKPDLIHVNNEPLCNRAGIFAGKLFNIPVVCHVRGDQKGSAMMKWLYRLPDHFIPVSNWVSASIGNLGVPESKRSVIYDGISFEQIDFNADGMIFRQKFGLAKDDFVVGLIGMLIPWKGQNEFLDAAKILKEKIPNLKMMIIGGTPDEFKNYELHLKERVQNENLMNCVMFTGHQTQMDIIYNGVNIAVSASNEPEPLGTMVIESLVMGRPLIAPAHGGGAEMVEDKKTGLLFKPGDGYDLARAVFLYYDDYRLRNSIGDTAKKRAQSTFSVERHVARVQTLYNEIIPS